MMIDDPTQIDPPAPEAIPDALESLDFGRKPAVLKPGLYLVATPIGNLRDITLRALDVLAEVDVIACEDTRVSAKLLSAYGLKKPLLPYHDHNADQQRPVLLKKIAHGERVALISDAGMPLISDPGFKLVRDAKLMGLYVTSLPGANAPLMALQLSGLPSDAFVFAGFLPSKTKARRDALLSWKTVAASLIVFESAPRLEECVADILAVLGDRDLAIARELTKMFEDVWSGTASSILERLSRDGPPKGEIVVVIGRGNEVMSDEQVDALLRVALADGSVKDAAEKVAALSGLSKKALYNRALTLRGA